MPDLFVNSLGTLAEGILSLKDGEWILVDSEGEEHAIHDLLTQWENRRVRFNIANLELLEALVEAGISASDLALMRRIDELHLEHTDTTSLFTLRRFPEPDPLFFGTLLRWVWSGNAGAGGRFRCDAHNFTYTAGLLTNLPACGCRRDSAAREKAQNDRQNRSTHIVLPLNVLRFE